MPSHMATLCPDKSSGKLKSTKIKMSSGWRIMETRIIVAVQSTKRSKSNISLKYSSKTPIMEWNQRRVKAKSPKMGKILTTSRDSSHGTFLICTPIGRRTAERAARIINFFAKTI